MPRADRAPRRRYGRRGGGHGPRRPAVLAPGQAVGPLERPAGTAHVWLADAARPPRAEHSPARVLDARERRRAAALHRYADRRCYVTAHVALRVLLGAYLGLAPERVRLVREPCPCCGEPHGRPAVAGAPLHFSLSHSGDLVLLAFAASPVGVDVQTTTGSGPDVAEEVRGVLHPREEAELSRCDPASRMDAFARAWVRKEAYLKGLGTGLARSAALDYLGTGAGPVAGPPGWRVQDVTVPAGYAAALAVRDLAAGAGGDR